MMEVFASSVISRKPIFNVGGARAHHPPAETQRHRTGPSVFKSLCYAPVRSQAPATDADVGLGHAGQNQKACAYYGWGSDTRPIVLVVHVDHSLQSWLTSKLYS